MSDALFIEALVSGGTSDASIPPAELPRQGQLVIGSNPERVSLLLTGQGVAPVHCTIGRLKKGGWALKDLGSDFGTRLNGQPVTAARLKDGDEILIGSRKLRIYSNAAAAGSKSPAPKTPAAPGPTSKAKDTPPKKAAAPAPAPKAAPKAARPKKPAAPRELAGYRLEKPLGRGAMGDVYLAVQTSLDRRVALKVLKGRLAKDQTFVARFRDEARSAARLNHPNIVTVFDVGSEGDQHFLSMEYMDGGSVEDRLKGSGPLPWREALDVIRDAAAGLVYAETSGIVHRDIKPENLMRNKDGATKIADLGLAIQVEQEIVEAESGKIFGTPHFLAPEVARGQAATASSDLYSLGATAYRILSGQTPFEGASPKEILRSALADEETPLTELVPGLPPAVGATVHRLLSKGPEGRHPSAAILLTEIERLRQSDGKQGGADAPGAQGGGLPKPVLFGGLALLAAGALALALTGGDKEPKGREPDAFGTRPSDNPAPSDVATSDGDAGTTDDGTRTDPDSGPANVDLSGTGTAAQAGSGTGEAESNGGDEADFEYRASLAYLELGDEALSPTQRAARLRALSEAFMGTDTATKAAAEAEALEGNSAKVEAAAAALTKKRNGVLEALRTAAGLDASPFHPGTALRSMRLVEGQSDLSADLAFRSARNLLIDEVMQLGLERGRTALTEADTEEAAGNFNETLEALRGFIGATDLPTPEEAPMLSDANLPGSLAEFQALAGAVRSRIESMAGNKDEFDADRMRQERVTVGRELGATLEADLLGFRLAEAAERMDRAAILTTAEPLRTHLVERGQDLRAALAAVEGLTAGWKTPGWHRRSVTDPRPGASGSVEIVGIKGGVLMVDGDAGEVPVPLELWSRKTSALKNLFLSRLEREWTPLEARGIATLLGVAASLESMEQLAPGLLESAKRLPFQSADEAVSAFSDALAWAQEADEDLGLSDPSRSLVDIVQRQRQSAHTLAGALLARDEGQWAASAERLQRLIDERRDTWVVMILSDGGKR